MKFLKDVEKHVTDLFKGKDIVTNGIMLVALAVIVWFLVDFFVKKLPASKEGLDEGFLHLFHANGCGHCKKMMPDWDKFCKQGEFKCKKTEASTSNPEDIALMKKLDVKGFPSIFFRKGNNTTEFKGDRTVKGFGDFCKSFN
jgi:thiol-disulfide isomerase/thioredoxin